MSETAGAGAEWAVTTWNVHGSEGPDIGALAAALREQSPDIVAIQEIRRHQASELAEALGMRFAWAMKHKPYGPLLPRRAEGLAIFTPHVLDAVAHAEISNGESKWSWRRRIALWGLVGRPDGTAVRIYDVHLSPHEDAASRRSEALVVTQLVTDHGADPPAVVAGDLNDDLDSTVIFSLPGIEHLTPPPTSPATDPRKLLDHVLLPADASDVTVSVPGGGPEWSAMSDHLPVTVRFSLPVGAH